MKIGYTFSMKNSILDNMKSAIFDMDGTILDSMTMWHTIADRYLESIGKVPRKDLWDNVKRLNMIETAQYFIDEYGVQKTIEEIGVEVKELIMKFYAESLELKEGAREFLEKLNEKEYYFLIELYLFLELINLFQKSSK